jgi:hypothetical protein
VNKIVGDETITRVRIIKIGKEIKLINVLHHVKNKKILVQEKCQVLFPIGINYRFACYHTKCFFMIKI